MFNWSLHRASEKIIGLHHVSGCKPQKKENKSLIMRGYSLGHHGPFGDIMAFLCILACIFEPCSFSFLILAPHLNNDPLQCCESKIRISLYSPKILNPATSLFFKAFRVFIFFLTKTFRVFFSVFGNCCVERHQPLADRHEKISSPEKYTFHPKLFQSLQTSIKIQ